MSVSSTEIANTLLSEGIALSRSTVRRILLGVGLKGPRKRRSPQHRRRRERAPQEGMLLQIDGSRHDWLEGRGPWLTLVAAVDDATERCPPPSSGSRRMPRAISLLLKGVIEGKGVPLVSRQPNDDTLPSPAPKGYTSPPGPLSCR